MTATDPAYSMDGVPGTIDPPVLAARYSAGAPLRQLASEIGRSNQATRKLLIAEGVTIRSRSEALKGLKRTDEVCQAISQRMLGNRPWNTGLVFDEGRRRDNMSARWGGLDLHAFPDYQRLKFLTRHLTRQVARGDFPRPQAQAFLNRFYTDLAFNAIYDAWQAHGEDKWWYPSIDHIVPGLIGLDNLRFVTWFENRAKEAMTLGEWLLFRTSTRTDSSLFVENILGVSD